MSDDDATTDPWSEPVVAVDLTPSLLNGILIQLSRERRGLVKEFKKLGTAAAKARKNAEVTFSRAFMKAEGQPMDVRRQIAMDAAADARFEADLADRAVAGCKAAIESVHDDIDIARTVSATTRDELKTLGATQ